MRRYNISGGHLLRSSDLLKPPSFDEEESSKNIQSNMYGSTAKAISHYKDKQKFVETLNFGRKLFCRATSAVSKKSLPLG